MNPLYNSAGMIISLFDYHIIAGKFRKNISRLRTQSNIHNLHVDSLHLCVDINNFASLTS